VLPGRLKVVWEHKTGAFDGFTKRYKIDRLVYYKTYKYVNNVIAREKQIKRWSKIKKVRLIVGMNPAWRDLSEGWYPKWRKKAMHRSLDCALLPHHAKTARVGGPGRIASLNSRSARDDNSKRVTVSRPRGLFEN